jgi:hypothetical protein
MWSHLRDRLDTGLLFPQPVQYLLCHRVAAGYPRLPLVASV